MLTQLVALREQVNAAIALVGDELELGNGNGPLEPARPGTGTDTGCPHPPGSQVNATTMGGPPRVHCLVCDTEYAGVLVTP